LFNDSNRLRAFPVVTVRIASLFCPCIFVVIYKPDLFLAALHQNRRPSLALSTSVNRAPERQISNDLQAHGGVDAGLPPIWMDNNIEYFAIQQGVAACRSGVRPRPPSA
jgi:hypothetical protein